MKILFFTFLVFAFTGAAKGTSDRISWGDLLNKFKFWSRKNTGTKDKNQDGKVSYLEKFFPFDGWHLMEWMRILPFGILVAILLDYIFPDKAIIYQIEVLQTIAHWQYIISLGIILTAIYNLSFLIIYGLLPKLLKK